MAGTPQELPDLTHCQQADAATLARLCDELLWLRGDPNLARWGKDLARSKELVSAAERTPMLRVLLQVAAMLGAEGLLPRLREIYPEPLAEGLLQAETSAAEEHAVADLLASARGWLGILRRRRRRRPFRIGGGPEQKSGKAPVGVLVIEPGDARGDADGLRSIESQTFGPAAIVSVHGEGTLTERIAATCADLETPYAALLSAGARYHPERIEAGLAALQGASQPCLLCTGLFLVDAKGRQISAAASSRLDLGSAAFDWIQAYDRLRPSPRARNKLVDDLLATDFVLSLGNLLCPTSYLQDLISKPRASDRPLGWQLALDAAVDGRLLYLPRKLLALRLPKSAEIGRPKPLADATYLQLTRARRSRPTVRREATVVLARDEAAPTQPPDEGPGRVRELDRALASALTQKDRMSRKIAALTRNRDRLEQVLSDALSARAAPTSDQPAPLPRLEIPVAPRTQDAQPRSFPRRLPGVTTRPLSIAAPLPPDQETMHRFRRLCKHLDCRPLILHWQGDASRLASGTLLRSDADAQDEDLGYLRRNRTRPLQGALTLMAEALQTSPREVERLPELRRAYTFARKIEKLGPDYLHSWDLGAGSTAALLAQLLFGIRRGLVLRALPRVQGLHGKLLPLQLAAADFVIVHTPELAKHFRERGVAGERILLDDANDQGLAGALADLRAKSLRAQGIKK